MLRIRSDDMNWQQYILTAHTVPCTGPAKNTTPHPHPPDGLAHVCGVS